VDNGEIPRHLGRTSAWTATLALIHFTFVTQLCERRAEVGEIAEQLVALGILRKREGFRFRVFGLLVRLAPDSFFCLRPISTRPANGVWPRGRFC
jgi:hypothetical protein